MAYSPSGTAPLPFHHGKATLGPRNTLSSSKLNRLHVKRVGVLFRQIHICRGFSHFSSHATVTQCCSQENWSLLWRDNSSSAGWRCRQRSLSFCLLCSCLWDKGTLCSVETLHWHLNYWRLESAPLPMTAVGTGTSGAQSFKAPVTHSHYMSEKPPH